MLGVVSLSALAFCYLTWHLYVHGHESIMIWHRHLTCRGSQAGAPPPEPTGADAAQLNLAYDMWLWKDGRRILMHGSDGLLCIEYSILLQNGWGDFFWHHSPWERRLTRSTLLTGMRYFVLIHCGWLLQSVSNLWNRQTCFTPSESNPYVGWNLFIGSCCRFCWQFLDNHFT